MVAPTPFFAKEGLEDQLILIQRSHLAHFRVRDIDIARQRHRGDGGRSSGADIKIIGNTSTIDLFL